MAYTESAHTRAATTPNFRAQRDLVQSLKVEVETLRLADALSRGGTRHGKSRVVREAEQEVSHRPVPDSGINCTHEGLPLSR